MTSTLSSPSSLVCERVVRRGAGDAEFALVEVEDLQAAITGTILSQFSGTSAMLGASKNPSFGRQAERAGQEPRGDSRGIDKIIKKKKDPDKAKRGGSGRAGMQGGRDTKRIRTGRT